MNEVFANYPTKVKASTQHIENYYVLQKGVYAVHGEVPPSCKTAIKATIVEGQIVICQGNPDELPSSVKLETITPVYALAPSGPFAVPTGRILVRYADHITAIKQKTALERIGYIIDQDLLYAPQALWVKPANGDIAYALNNISLLEAQADVENIEPQMLMESVRRDSNSRPL